MSDLKPCPFCGGDANAIPSEHADDCYFSIMRNVKLNKDSADCSFVFDAIEAWNRRAQPAQAVPSDVLRNAERYLALRAIENRMPAAVFQFHQDTALPNKHMILIGGHLDAFCDAYMKLKGTPSPAAQGAKT